MDNSNSNNNNNNLLTNASLGNPIHQKMIFKGVL